MSKKKKKQTLVESLKSKLGEGRGDYTRDRHQCLDQMTLEEIFQAMREVEKADTTQYDEIC